jgi:hypothetical protein
MSEFVKKVLNAKRESKSIEFKESLNVDSQGEWLEVIKDMVAIANSGGGVILIGVDNHGIPTGIDAVPLLEFDSADITNKIHKYTGIQFSEFEVIEEEKAGSKVVMIRIQSVSVPIVFTKPGTYDSGGGKQKTAFGVGTIYFRHGAKSEPGNTDDIRKAIERQLEIIRKDWIRGVRKVVTAPQGSKIIVASGQEFRESDSPHATPIRIVDDASAPAYRKVHFDLSHPHRLKELIQRLNEKLDGKGVVGTYEILCLRRLYDLDGNTDFCHKPRFASMQYSDAFIDWIMKQVEKNPRFLEETRAECHSRRLELKLYSPPKRKRGGKLDNKANACNESYP